MARHIELNPTANLTIGAIGDPGNRVFYIQGSRGNETVSLLIEKQQAAMLVNGLEALIEELRAKSLLESKPVDDSVWKDMRLREPVDPLFRVGNMGLGYNESLHRVVLVAYELVDEDEESNVVSYWVNIGQAQALIPHVREVISAGRPLCGNCGQPIDADGHFCPHRNGHKV